MSRKERLHFVGIGGAGMSSLARFAREAGHPVSGSDLRDSPVLTELKELGCTVHGSHDASLIESADVVVYSSAIPDHNPELAAARTHDRIQVLHRGELLADFVAAHPEGVAICGTHGKGTTAGALVEMAEAAKKSVGYVLGAPRRSTGRASHAPATSDLLVAEVDESDRTHEHHRPRHLLINNLEADHLNVYGSLDAIVDSFASFCGRFRENNGGDCIIGLDGAGSRALLARLEAAGLPVLTCALGQPADIEGRELLIRPNGTTSFELYAHGTHVGTIESALKGELNARNLVAASALALQLELDFTTIAHAASRYTGLVDRFHEFDVAGRVIVTDYTSHPTSIGGNLKAMRARTKGTLHAVFQPFRYSLLQHHWAGYVNALSQADQVHLAPLDPGGESPVQGVSGAALASAIDDSGASATEHPDLDSIETRLEMLQPGDTAIIFGGGPLFHMGRQIARGFLHGANPGQPDSTDEAEISP